MWFGQREKTWYPLIACILSDEEAILLNDPMKANPKASRPGASEYAPYYGRYISLVPDGDILSLLPVQVDETLTLLRSVPESHAGHRYASGKWSIKEVVGHVIDAERVFAYRALRFARRDQTPLSGFEQDDYVRNGSFDGNLLSDLSAELEQVRRASVLLFRHLDQEAWARSGVASGNEVSVRALAYIIAGHELHHREILRTRYLDPPLSDR